MGLLLKCIECKSEDQLAESEYMIKDIRDDGQYNVTCPNGHKTIIMASNFKFEFLFESAALALLDGHTFESVASMHAAFERFLEFYIRVSSLKRSIQGGEFNKNWNNAKNKSERQIGALLFCTFWKTGRQPQSLLNDYPIYQHSEAIIQAECKSLYLLAKSLLLESIHSFR